MPEKDTRSNNLLEWENTPIEALKLSGLGPKSKAKLLSAGLIVVRDLIFLLPRRYRDYSRVTSINDAPVNRDVHLQGSVLRANIGKTYQKRLPFLEILLDDGSGTIRIIWFRQAYLHRVIKSGIRLSVFGKVGFDRTGRYMSNPQFDVLDAQKKGPAGIESIYRQIGGLRSQQIAKWIVELLKEMPDGDSMPTRVLHSLGLPDRRNALTSLHQPPDSHVVEMIGKGCATAWVRLVFEEFFYFHWGLMGLSKTSKKKSWSRISVPGDAIDSFQKMLPFRLTHDQMQVMDELSQVLNSQQRVFSLIQGDVGCGKTVVGLFMAWIFARAGFQTALLCPTTVLAGQHFETARQLLSKAGLRVSLLTGFVPTHEQARELEALSTGETDLLIGSHKIFQADVLFNNLGLVMVDEQHRFGVNQRSALLAKGDAPHYMTFSATPIPRSLAMAVYAGYEILQIRQKPAGRKDVKTILKKAANRDQIVSFVKKRISHGERVFWIFPLIQGKEDQLEKSAVSMYQKLKKVFSPQVSVSLVHGRLPGEEIQREMEQFKRGTTQILVATSVVEVGVDVSAATIIVIECAQYFGLSQLHQLRGRVGRSDRPSFCFFVVDEDVGRDGLKRLRFLESCQDGFEIARFDLEQRGFGELLGKRQSGFDIFRFGDPIKQKKWFDLARSTANQSFSRDEIKALNRWGRNSWWRSSRE